VLLLGATLLPQARPEDGAGYRVVVSSGSPLTTVTRRELAKVFLRKASRWPDGREAQPVDQSARSQVRAAFTREVLGAEGLGLISAVESYWAQQVYSGRNAPPPVKSSDAEVVAFVAAHEGAVGYVSSGTALQGVKALALQE
jgi:ABC-type phosphate transport system substrate-binding protein